MMADLLANYDALHSELAIMNSRIQQFLESNQQLKAVVESLPGNALGGAAMMELVTHLNGLQQRLNGGLAQYLALLNSALEAVRELQTADANLQTLVPQI
jgi:uncharacterized protein involved in exopolysaccharide biosynthesis